VHHRSRRHVLGQGAAVQHIQQLVPPADAEHRQAGADRLPRDVDVQDILGVVDVVAHRALLLAVEAGVQVAAARKDDAVERLESGGRRFSGSRGRGEQHRFAPAVAHQLHDVVEEFVGLGHPGIGVGGAAEAGGNAHAGPAAGGVAGSLHDLICNRIRGLGLPDGQQLSRVPRPVSAARSLHPSPRTLEVESLDSFDRLVASGARTIHGWHAQSLDLRGRSSPLAAMDVQGAVFLGCTVDEGAEDSLRSRGVLIFPKLGGVPFNPYRGRLYSPRELYAGIETSRYEDTLDAGCTSGASGPASGTASTRRSPEEALAVLDR
jgi:hypothetical protein